MPVIFDNNGLWTEVIIIVRAAIAGTTSRTVDTTLLKPGRYLGAVSSLESSGGTGGLLPQVQTSVSNTDNSELALGQNITAIRSVMRNENVGAATVGLIVAVYLGD